MAEARREEEDEGERRDRSQTADLPERTKAEHLVSSQGPLSSIRAAIKRTRTNSQSDNSRDRRRPEITIVSAEPLASNSWFPPASVVFPPPPPPPPPPQPGWSAGIQAVSQPPPSYDQVIKEKTHEDVKPTAAPRRTSCTTTSATQTDPVKEDNTSTECSPTPQSAGKRSSGEKPQKPPRPSLPKSGIRKATTEAHEKTSADANTDEQSDSKSDVKQPEKADCTHTYTGSVTVHWNIPTSVSVTAEASSSDHSQRPVPRPRTKARKPAAEEEAKGHILVKLNDSCDTNQSDPLEVSSSQYLKELLEVFSAGDECEENSDVVEASQVEDAVDEMNNIHTQRNIRARIQAFEGQAGSEEENVSLTTKPDPLPRRATTKPPVAAKPSVALRPLLSLSTDNIYQIASATNTPLNPTPATRPQPPKKPVGLSIKEELEALHSRTDIPHRSRNSVLSRANCIDEVEPSPAPPVPPVKPSKEPLKPNLNINNHNSVSIFRENEYETSLQNLLPVVLQQNVDSNGASFNRQSMTRRPTTIRVPSKSSILDSFQDSLPPPPLPAQKPVGSLNTQVNQRQSLTPALSLQDFYSTGPEPSLPPRKPSVNRSLPPRPPPAKAGPGRPPPPNFQATRQTYSLPQEASPKPQAQRSQRKVLPPRPNPGHRLYNKYTLQLPHGIASFDYNGSNTGELSFQKNEVLVLLEEINHNEFECQVGEARGRVHKSRMKVITPLGSYMSAPEAAAPPASDRDGIKVQAVHDFIPEGPGELCLKAGDVVTRVEQVDSEWYRGTCRGSTGYFPVNYVKVLSNSPNQLSVKKPKKPAAAISGPRCVARFDFEGEHSDELSFTEGDVIQLKEYVGEDWARGQIGVVLGIFPLNFVEVIEDLPPPPSQQQSTKIALPGMAAASPSMQPEVAKPAQSSVEWAVALYDYTGKSGDDLSFQQGDCILITEHLNAEWSCGRLNGREGMFPRAFVESTAGQQSINAQQNGATVGGRARALYSFTSDCEEELSIQVGDIITNIESIDEEWFLGDLRGKRALVPKNYVQVLE
ncbi:SH3 domain-containing protein 19 [Parambassis ranga]|uniref:SH3 domain-containing protein 19 n=1 Tax=Parambassis ranga TaxID=210632 RepID=A0A6P7I4J3_9TELE|nr:SH3 domain-containing protein 19 [Parambassis ranga]